MYKTNYGEISQADNYFSLTAWLVPIGVALLLIAISYFNFLLFHTLAEFFAITIAILTCVVAWNMYPFTRNNYLMYLGAGYFWIGVLDLLHALSYKDMNVLPYGGANMSAQFWIGTRYLEALLLVSAPWFLTHTLQRIQYFVVYGVASAAIILFIWTGLFPETFAPGKGLTQFKIYSEYLIITLLGLAIYFLYKRKEFLEKRILNVLIISIIFTMGAELAFTYYVSVFGISNIVGHILKIFSFWLIFLAIIRTTLEKPFLALSQGASTYDTVPDATIVVDKDGIIRQANIAAARLSGLQKEKLMGKEHHDIFHSDKFSSANCPVCQAISKRHEFIGYEMEISDREKWYDFSISYMAVADQYAGAVEVIRDITKRKNTENALSEIDILKKSIIENLPLTLFVKEADTLRYVEWNKAAEELTGVMKEEMLGRSDFDFWPKEEAQEFTAIDTDVLHKKILLDIPEETITTRQKGLRTVHTKKIPIYDTDGKARYLLGIAEDI
ncbi:MAG: PAS domain S-box protein, partial [Gammaproteobacteria bacterium]|nr:PAS domain S-box protein [Gammaproteobacteria bacterium]